MSSAAKLVRRQGIERTADARDLAVSLVAAIQGAALLASTFRDPEILTRQARRLSSWIDPLAVSERL